MPLALWNGSWKWEALLASHLGWLSEREIILIADNTYAALEWLGRVRGHVTAITPLRLDARLHAPAPS